MSDLQGLSVNYVEVEAGVEDVKCDSLLWLGVNYLEKIAGIEDVRCNSLLW